MHTEDLYAQPLPEVVANRRTGAMPDGMPTPTGRYPNISGSRTGPTPVGGNVVFDDLYPAGVNAGSLDWTERVDQHSYLQVSATWTPAPNDRRPSGRQDPLTDGPPQPFLDDLSVWFNTRQGTSVTAFLDAPGIQYPATGQQDGASWTYLQSTGLALENYTPSRLDPGTGQMPDTLRALPPSPPHGWAEQPPTKSQQENNAKAAALVQQQPGKQERIANSTFAGQSFGQRTLHVGEATGGTSTVSAGRGAVGGRGR